jgi:uncharacterized protein YycO
MIYLYLSTVKTDIASKLIRWNTRCEYSHVGFYDSSKDAYFSAQLKGGVQWRTKAGITSHIEYSTSHCYLSVDGIERALTQALKQEGKRYDWTAILGLATNRNWREDDSWFCSELVAYSFEQAGIPLLNPNVYVWRITPRDILLSLAIKEAQGCRLKI